MSARSDAAAGVAAGDLDAVLDLAVDVARRRRAPLVVVGERNATPDRRCRALMHRARGLGAHQFQTTVDLVGALRDAGQRAQLIVLGPQPGQPLGVNSMISSAVHDLVGRCPCPLMVAPRSGRG